MGTQLQSLDDILAYIVSSPPSSTLNDKLGAVAKKEYGEAVLASVLHGGQDPLAALDPARNTIGYLYIL
jgi:COP9 signalosome complex subunit 3